MAVTATTQDVRVLQNNMFDYVVSPTIRIQVGEEPEISTFSVHQALICSRSEFFSKVMSESWNDAEDRIVALPEDESDIVSMYLKPLYTNKLPVKITDAKLTEKSTVIDEYRTLSKLYVFAEKLVDTTTKDLVLAAIAARAKEPCKDKCSHYPENDSVQIIYDGTPESSPACLLLVQLYAEFGDSSSVHFARAEAVPKDFLYELSIKVLSTRPLPSDYDKTTKDKLSSKNKALMDNVVALVTGIRAYRHLSLNSGFRTRLGHSEGIWTRNLGPQQEQL